MLTNVTYLATLRTRMSAWGDARLDFDGTPCTGWCSSTCAVSTNPVWASTCLNSLTCPPAGVAGYKVLMRTTVNGAVSDFGADEQLAFKQGVARYFSQKGAPVNIENILLTISAGSVVVDAEISTPSSLARQIITDAVSNMTANDAAIYFNTSIASIQTSATVTTTAGISGSLGAPENNKPPPPGGISVAVIIAVLLVLGGLGWGIYNWMQNREASPMMKSHQLQDSQPGVTMAGSRAPPAQAPPNSSGGVVVMKNEKHELAEHI